MSTQLGGVPGRCCSFISCKRWLFYSAGPLDGGIAFAFLGCKMGPGSWAEAFDENEAYQACYLQEMCDDDSRLCPSLQQHHCIPSAGSQALLSRAGAPGAFGEVICKADL